MISIPTLETERLIMRPPGPQDFAAYRDFLASDRSKTIGGPYDAQQAWFKLAAIIGHWTMRGYGRWALDAKDGATALGFVGVLHSHDWPEPEIGWTVFEGAEGKSYAYEAAKAAQDYVYSALGWNRIVSLIDAANARSLALANRLGAQHEYDFKHPNFGTLGVYVHPTPEAVQ